MSAHIASVNVKDRVSGGSGGQKRHTSEGLPYARACNVKSSLANRAMTSIARQSSFGSFEYEIFAACKQKTSRTEAIDFVLLVDQFDSYRCSLHFVLVHYPLPPPYSVAVVVVVVFLVRSMCVASLCPRSLQSTLESTSQ